MVLIQYHYHTAQFIVEDNRFLTFSLKTTKILNTSDLEAQL
jgi:hypothetical protein